MQWQWYFLSHFPPRMWLKWRNFPQKGGMPARKNEVWSWQVKFIWAKFHLHFISIHGKIPGRDRRWLYAVIVTLFIVRRVSLSPIISVFRHNLIKAIICMSCRGQRGEPEPDVVGGSRCGQEEGFVQHWPLGVLVSGSSAESDIAAASAAVVKSPSTP